MLKLKEQKVRELIGKTGLSVRAWGLEHKFPQATLSSWITGSRHITKPQLIKLADALNVDNLNEISSVVFHFDPKNTDQVSAELNEIRDIWGWLTSEERSQMLSIIKMMAQKNIDIAQKETDRIVREVKK